MDLKSIAHNFNNQTLPGIKSIKKHPSIDTEEFKTYGKLFIQKYFLNDGRKPNKMLVLDLLNQLLMQELEIQMIGKKWLNWLWGIREKKLKKI